MQLHILSFEGPDSYSGAGGIATRGLAGALQVARWDPDKRWLRDDDGSLPERPPGIQP